MLKHLHNAIYQDIKVVYQNRFLVIFHFDEDLLMLVKLIIVISLKLTGAGKIYHQFELYFQSCMNTHIKNLRVIYEWDDDARILLS